MPKENFQEELDQFEASKATSTEAKEAMNKKLKNEALDTLEEKGGDEMSKQQVRENLKSNNGSSAEKTSSSSSARESMDERLTKCIEALTGKVEDHKKVLDDHETRITRLEERLDVKEKSETKSEPETKTEATKAEVKSEAVKAEKTCTSGYTLADGPAEMYKYWDYKRGVWAGPKQNLFAAKAAGNGVWEPVWVWIINGKIDHALTVEEIEKYCP